MALRLCRKPCNTSVTGVTFFQHRIYGTERDRVKKPILKKQTNQREHRERERVKYDVTGAELALEIRRKPSNTPKIIHPSILAATFFSRVSRLLGCPNIPPASKYPPGIYSPPSSPLFHSNLFFSFFFFSFSCWNLILKFF